MPGSRLSDEPSVTDVMAHPAACSLTLSASCEADAPRAVRFLTGAVLACGGCVLSRSFEPGDCAAIEFQFARSVCVEMYSVLLAAGLELCPQSHHALASLCQCARATSHATAADLVHIDLAIRAASAARRDQRILLPPATA